MGNADLTVFSDILTIKPINVGRLAVFHVGNIRDEVIVQIDDKEVVNTANKFDMSKTGFGRKQCGFHYDSQIFNAQLKKIEVPISPNETVIINTSLTQYTSRANFLARFQL